MPVDIKKELRLWDAKIGRKEAEKRLCIFGLSWSLAGKLLSGIYESEIGTLQQEAIEKAMSDKKYKEKLLELAQELGGK